jgi:hypothetical protein
MLKTAFATERSTVASLALGSVLLTLVLVSLPLLFG